MHNGTPAYFRYAVRHVLSDAYLGRWIGRGGHTAWPPHSPELNPMDFYPWEYIRTFVCVVPIATKRHFALWMSVRVAEATLSIFERTWHVMMRRVEECMESHGERFEHSL
jgi:hypothetical protein